jgi:uncharacterized BrkB/YihY/UPF0761 family membrane protein
LPQSDCLPRCRAHSTPFWDVENKTQPILEAIRTRAVALVVVIVIALLLMVLLGVDAMLNTSSFFSAVSRVAQFVVSLVLTAAAFTVLFAFLPETRIECRTIVDLRAFGGLVAFLIWVNYSAQIVLLGAEFTHVLATRVIDGPIHSPRAPAR